METYIYIVMYVKREMQLKKCEWIIITLFNIIRFKQFQHRLYNKLPLHHNLKLKQFYN